MTDTIRVERTSSPLPHPEASQLGFGRFFTDHMFVMDYEQGRGWFDGRIVPHGPMPIDPAAGGLQYGQSLFEGLKAYATANGRVAMFRPEAHARRLNASAERLCMPTIEPERLIHAMRELLTIDRAWVPTAAGTSVYLRPTMFATEAFLGVRPSNRYALVVLASPVGAYFTGEARPLRIWVERTYARAVRGGIGAAKTGGNYAASLLAAEAAKKRGFDQVLWLDALHHADLEEVGTMNMFVVIGDEVITPPLDGALLAGVTRDSVLTLLREWGVRVSERKLPLDEIAAAHRAGTLREMFGTGTAAVIAPVGEIAWESGSITAKGTEIGSRLRETLEAVHYGRSPDRWNWLVDV
jgi:branched-chain amino acid aminotransferase